MHSILKQMHSNALKKKQMHSKWKSNALKCTQIHSKFSMEKQNEKQMHSKRYQYWCIIDYINSIFFNFDYNIDQYWF